jgi:hypothetical protein
MHLAILFLAVLACLLVFSRRVEGMDALADIAAPVQAQLIVSEISKNVQLPKGSVTKIAFSNVEAGPAQAASMWATMFQGQPAYSADLSGRAKVVTIDNAVVVPSKFTVRGAGESEAAAKKDANAKAAAVIRELEKSYENAGVLASPDTLRPS